MKNKVIRIKTAVVIVAALLFGGCSDQILHEDIGFILQMGLEEDDEGQFVYSVTYPVTSENAVEQTGFLSITGDSLMRVAREELRDRSGKILLAGKVQNVMYSEELARKGMKEFLEIFIRNPHNPMQANVVIVDGSPKEMMQLSLNYIDKPRSAFYVNDLMKDGLIKSIVSEYKLYSIFLLDYAKTIDAFIPILKYDSGGIEIKGSALLDGDRMVGEISKEQTILLNLLVGSSKKGRYELKQPVSDENPDGIRTGAAIVIVKAKRHIQIRVKTGQKLRTDIELKLRVRVEEYAGPHHLENDEKMKQFEALLANTIKSDCLELLRIIQEAGSDPLGLEEMFRSRNNEAYKQMNWDEEYRNMQFHMDVKVKVESFGVMS